MVFLEWRDSICLLISAPCMLTHTSHVCTSNPSHTSPLILISQRGQGFSLKSPQPRHIPQHPQFHCDRSERYVGLLFKFSFLVQIKRCAGYTKIYSANEKFGFLLTVFMRLSNRFYKLWSTYFYYFCPDEDPVSAFNQHAWQNESCSYNFSSCSA